MEEPHKIKGALVVGAGPAGLMAAGELARAAVPVTVVDAKPSFGRKLLMAGKSGLNLTKAEPLDTFLAHYSGSTAPLIREAVRAFPPDAVAHWAESLGQTVFTGSSGRVFPKAMKASPLLRAWLEELSGLGVAFHTRWRWAGFNADTLLFDTPEGPRRVSPEATILALGGASWPRLGSDGAWAECLSAQGVALTPFAPANAGLTVDWSPHMEKHFGAPVKAARLSANGLQSPGEFVISCRGLEGSGVYALTRPVREGAPLTLDLCPGWSETDIVQRLARPRGKATVAAHLRKTLRLDPPRLALLMEFGRPLPEGAALARLVKTLPVRHTGPRPLPEAISTAGGIAAQALDTYRLKALPTLYAAGEMLDWEAPTGGYLLTACLATGRAAARQAVSALAR